MSSTTNLVRLNQCVLEKLTPFKPLKVTNTQCPIHLFRANCKVIKRYDAETDTDFDCHLTVLNGVYQNYNREPFYMSLINANNDLETRGAYSNANDMVLYIELRRLDDDEKFLSIDAAGERNVATIRNVIKTIMDAFAVCIDRYILMVDELQIDLVYSLFRSIILPQRMITMYTDESVPANDDVQIFNVPSTESAFESQLIYRTFLMYNTVFTMILKQSNPFNDNKKNISVIFRTLGKCPNNRDRVKCCDLQYGANAPGHIMCPPREMIKKIFHYSKWARTPNNYKRYFELIVAQTVPNRRFDDNDTNDDSGAAAHRNNSSLIKMDWYNFIDDFRRYFGIVLE
ncbi:capsid protein [Alphabaculovirus altersperidaniae]|uniref:Capsid protein n=1 Tax=Spodoptera eridania nucleopolyhedrovirus TaxID=2315721 RepID=A0ABX6TQA5_9ABAC|nr:capsid protein [Spodoptera eridania nucleopolyhedrovirus]QNV47898.1 capsid protein [Spodoptera eridania nucleopolyhedrovirus]